MSGMTLKRAGICMLALVLLGIARSSYGSEGYAPRDFTSVGPTVFQAVEAAKVIARVRLLRRDAVRNAGTATPCGYRYEAEVLEWIKPKTGTGRISWFSNVDSDFRGMTSDYLVFVSELTPSNPEPDALVDKENVEQAQCASGQRTYTSRKYLSMYAFDSRAKRSLPGEWLSPTLRAGIVWCWNGDVAAMPVGRNDHVRLGQDYEVESWFVVKREIRFAMTHPKSHFVRC